MHGARRSIHANRRRRHWKRLLRRNLGRRGDSVNPWSHRPLPAGVTSKSRGVHEGGGSAGAAASRFSDGFQGLARGMCLVGRLVGLRIRSPAPRTFRTLDSRAHGVALGRALRELAAQFVQPVRRGIYFRRRNTFGINILGMRRAQLADMSGMFRLRQRRRRHRGSRGPGAPGSEPSSFRALGSFRCDGQRLDRRAVRRQADRESLRCGRDGALPRLEQHTQGANFGRWRHGSVPRTLSSCRAAQRR